MSDTAIGPGRYSGGHTSVVGLLQKRNTRANKGGQRGRVIVYTGGMFSKSEYRRRVFERTPARRNGVVIGRRWNLRRCTIQNTASLAY